MMQLRVGFPGPLTEDQNMKTTKATARKPRMNREEWLTAYMGELAKTLMEPARKGSTADIKNWRISCGWPGGGSARTAIGQCWSVKSSNDGTTQMFISPLLASAEEVDHVILHEMVHASVGLECGHKGDFRKFATQLGMTGKMTATTAGPELRKALNAITKKLGKYPHAGMKPTDTDRKKQTTRMIKLECGDCGYVARTTQKWLDVGVPTCCCGGTMNVEIK